MIETQTLLRKASDVWMVPATSGNTWVERTSLDSLQVGDLSQGSRNFKDPGEARREAQDADHESQTSTLAAQRGGLLCDYCRLRFPDERGTMAALREWLGPMVNRGRGWRGWYSDSVKVLDGGLVCWHRDRERAQVEGILVDLPGKAVASLGDKLVPFMKWALQNGARATRVDYAIDDHDGLLTHDRLLDTEARGGMVSRWHGLTLIERRELGEVKSWTIYIGSRKSDCLVRIYDKRAEQHVEGPPWVRLELETKGKLADPLLRAYFSEGSQAIVGQINRRLRFVDHSETDTNVRRAPACDWWVKLLGSVRPGMSLLTGEKPVCTIVSMGVWLERQCAPTLATLLEADGGDLARIIGVAERGRSRLQPKHHAALAALGRIPSPGVRLAA